MSTVVDLENAIIFGLGHPLPVPDGGIALTDIERSEMLELYHFEIQGDITVDIVAQALSRLIQQFKEDNPHGL